LLLSLILMPVLAVPAGGAAFAQSSNHRLATVTQVTAPPAEPTA